VPLAKNDDEKPNENRLNRPHSHACGSMLKWLSYSACLSAIACSSPKPISDVSVEEIKGVELTWLGATTWLLRFGKSKVLFDAFFSRPVIGQEGSTEEGRRLMDRILSAGEAKNLDAILIGHAHYDHAIDAGFAANATGAKLYGNRTTCLIAESQGLASDRCFEVQQGGRFEIGNVQIQVVRSIHWWPEGIGKYDVWTEAHEPEEASMAPNGGLLSFDLSFPSQSDPISIFYQQSLDGLDGLDGSGENYRGNLESIFPKEGGTSIWMACGNCTSSSPLLDEYLSYIQPKYVIPMHWDGAMPSVNQGLSESFESTHFIEAVERADSEMILPDQYFVRYTLLDGQIERTASPIMAEFGL
jgi:hypothetical protein